MKTKLFAALSVAVMSLSVVLPSFTGVAQAGVTTTKTVYIDVEKNITGQNVILEPVAVTLNTTDTIFDATEQAIGASNIDANAGGTYVKAFKDSTASFTYPYTSLLPAIVFDPVTAYNQPIVSDPTWLREQEYDGISGWMFTVNNTDTYGGGTYYTAGTTLANVPNDAVIRWEFTMASGCDLGNSGYLPDGTVSFGYYNWNTSPTNPFFTRADKTDLIRAMADYTPKTDPDYADALEILQDLTASQNDVDDAVDALS